MFEYNYETYNYHIKVIATRPDGSPAAGESILVSVEDYRWDQPWALKKLFVTDNNGKVEFSIEEVPENITAFSVNVSVMLYLSSSQK